MDITEYLEDNFFHSEGAWKNSKNEYFDSDLFGKKNIGILKMGEKIYLDPFKSFITLCFYM